MIKKNLITTFIISIIFGNAYANPHNTPQTMQDSYNQLVKIVNGNTNKDKLEKIKKEFSDAGITAEQAHQKGMNAMVQAVRELMIQKIQGGNYTNAAWELIEIAKAEKTNDPASHLFTYKPPKGKEFHVTLHSLIHEFLKLSNNERAQHGRINTTIYEAKKMIALKDVLEKLKTPTQKYDFIVEHVQGDPRENALKFLEKLCIEKGITKPNATAKGLIEMTKIFLDPMGLLNELDADKIIEIAKAQKKNGGEAYNKSLHVSAPGFLFEYIDKDGRQYPVTLYSLLNNAVKMIETKELMHTKINISLDTQLDKIVEKLVMSQFDQ